MSKKSEANAKSLDTLKQEMEKKDAILEAMKAAFFNRAPFQGQVPTYEDLAGAASDYIQASYEFQKARFGRIRLKLSPTDLLR
jgi:hypothetical protein